MNILIKLRALLAGKKAYIVGALMMILGLLNNDAKLVLEGLGLVTLRAGIAGIAK
mgnify:CR=1 FL=1